MNLFDSRITLEQDEVYNGEMICYGELIDCNGYRFIVKGNLEQYNTLLNLNRGSILVDGNCSIRGNGILRMLYPEDRVRVMGDFEIASSLSHATMLKDGRFELYGNFQQKGDNASFAATGNHTMVFCGSQIQLVNFTDSKYSGFAKEEVLGVGYERTDFSLEMAGGILKNVFLGIGDALKEGISDFEQLFDLENIVPNIIDQIAEELLSIIAPEIVIALVSGYLIYGMYSITVSDMTTYQKARAYAKNVTQLFLMVVALKCKNKEIDGNDANVNDGDEISGIINKAGKNTDPDQMLIPEFRRRLLAETTEDYVEICADQLEEDVPEYLITEITDNELDADEVQLIICQVAEVSERLLTRADVDIVLQGLKEELPREDICELVKGGNYSDFIPPKVYINERGQVTNGIYIIDETGMLPHLAGGSAGKSRFDFDVDANKAVLDAAAYADTYDLWKPSSGNPDDFADKAKVFVTNGPVGRNSDGEWTDYINVYRTKTGYIHGCPGNP